MNCPLCHHRALKFQEIQKKEYFECSSCRLVFLSSAFHLAPDLEKAIYDFHQNDPKDLGYRTFLTPAFNAVMKYAPLEARGIDVGCGPGPTLSLMLKEQGFNVEIFDKYYYPDRSVFKKKYDFITCTEVIEHVSEVDAFLEKLIACLHSSGILVLMTKLLQEDQDFSTWYYKDDPTHISFFREQTVLSMAKKYHLTLRELTGQLVVFQKSQ